MTRENGFYWVQAIKGIWEVVEFYDRLWYVSDDTVLYDHQLHAIHAERIKEPEYQP